MQQFKPKELQEYLSQADEAPVLLDVREADEFSICAIKGSINIPLSHLHDVLQEHDSDTEIVLICHHGMRSQHAGVFLETHDYNKLINLVGGIDAWANDLDPDMPRY